MISFALCTWMNSSEYVNANGAFMTLTRYSAEHMPPRVNAPVAMIAAMTWITSHGDCSASRSGTTGV